MYLNTATIIGNLTRDPELKTLPSGIKVTSMSIATNRTWMKDGVKKEEVEYHNVVVFGRQAETAAQYLKKGSQALVEGRLQTRSWDDAGTGKKMYRTEVIADRVQFGSRKDGAAQTAAPTQSPVQTPTQTPQSLDDEYPEEDVNPEDIPF